MGLQGYIKLYRKLLENPVFQNSSLLKVFIWCLLKATHKERIQVVGLQKVKLLPGQFVYGRNKAAEELKLKPSTAHKYMLWLKDDGILNIHGNNRFSLVTVANWELYQVKDDENNSKSDSKITATEQQRDTNKNVKNIKNNIYVDFLEQIWKLYPIKKGKASINNTQIKKLYHIGLEEITRAIDRYKKEIETKQTEKQFIKHGSTFFNSGYVDYLDANYQPEEADKPKTSTKEVIIPEWYKEGDK